jgi:hypothetical protein
MKEGGGNEPAEPTTTGKDAGPVWLVSDCVVYEARW